MPVMPTPDFAGRVRQQLDEAHPGGLLDLLNWQAWGTGLAPVAAALTLAAWLGIGLNGRVDWQEVENGVTAETFATWTHSAADDAHSTVFMHPESTPDVLLETVLTGAMPNGMGEPDVR
ncbi:hypothetical protein BH23ACI1_BH23ACI1_02590 [soil metagenome]